MSESPYEPPSPSSPSTGPSGPRAGFWRRFVAALIDSFVSWGVPFVVLAIVFGAEAAYGLSFLASIVYFSYFEGSPSGQGIGKRLLGIRVIDFRTGGPIGYGRGFLRWVGRILSQIPLYLGYFWMLWDSEKQTWHDKIANCVVVPVDAYPVERWPG